MFNIQRITEDRTGTTFSAGNQSTGALGAFLVSFLIYKIKMMSSPLCIIKTYFMQPSKAESAKKVRHFRLIGLHID